MVLAQVTRGGKRLRPQVRSTVFLKREVCIDATGKVKGDKRAKERGKTGGRTCYSQCLVHLLFSASIKPFI